MTTSSCGSYPFASDFRRKILYFGRIFLLLVATACAAQRDQLPDAPASQLLARVAEQAPAQPPAQASTPAPAAIRIPAGTRLSLVLTRPVDSRSTPHGDQVFAQTTAPVIVDDQVAIPGGTYVQGKVETLKRNGTRAEMLMQSVSLVFPNGYIAKAGGPANMESDEWTAWNNPSPGAKAAMFIVPAISMPLGLLLGHAADGDQTTYLGGVPFTTPSHKGMAIGGAVGAGAGFGVALGLMAHSRGFYIDAGSTMAMKLPQEITLTQLQIDDANQKAAEQPAPPTPAPSRPALPQSPASGPTSCAVGEEWCEGRCMSPGDFVSNDSDCGRCGNRCSFNQSCTGGSCGCAAGYTSSMGRCVSSASFVSDNSNCGSCGHSCSLGESCTGGTCMKQP
jgi:hypothetical protein